MARKRKKRVKMRGQKTHGHGSKKKWRGSGSRGGVGLAGGTEHKKIWMAKYRPGHIGHRGFKSLEQKKIRPDTRSINLKDLAKYAGQGEIDVTQLGYDKVLGTGSITKPVTVKARSFSRSAKDKIENAGGKAVVLEEE